MQKVAIVKLAVVLAVVLGTFVLLNHFSTIGDPSSSTHPYVATLMRMEQLGSCLMAYSAQSNSPPATLHEVLLSPLAQPIRKRWGPDVLKDGWEHPLTYRIVGTNFVLASAGPDGVANTSDDIVYELQSGAQRLDGGHPGRVPPKDK